jgi:hypothetical protein
MAARTLDRRRRISPHRHGYGLARLDGQLRSTGALDKAE